jgi:hypothetical protein
MAKAKRESKNSRTKLPSATKPPLETKPLSETEPLQLPDGTKLPPGTKLSSKTGLPLGWGPIKPPPGWRRSSKFPDYYETDDLPKPAVTESSEMEIIGRKLRERASTDEATTDRRWTKDDWVKHAKEYPLSNGRRIEARVAKVMMTIFSPVKRMGGGRPPNPENREPVKR